MTLVERLGERHKQGTEVPITGNSMQYSAAGTSSNCEDKKQKTSKPKKKQEQHKS